MIKLKNLLMESVDLIQVLLKKLEPTIKEMIKRNQEAFEKKHERKMSKFDLEYLRLYLTADLVRAIEKYTKSSDNLIKFGTKGSGKGNVTINATIERDGQQHLFSTEVIYAVGHNIQQLHYRYITRTTIPKTGNDTLAKKYKERIKRLSKVEKINKEIDHYRNEIEKDGSTIEKMKN